jgi:DNA processing protein
VVRARIALASVCEPGEAGLADLIDQRGPTAVIASLLAGTAVGIPRAAAIGARLAELDLDAQLDRVGQLGARVIVPGNREWPGRMDDLGPHRPLALWCWGQVDLRLHALTSIAMVGARACSRYGEMVSREWSAILASQGVAIVSGGAYGIDGAAHRGALATDGITICVLAGGVDNVYPRGHEGLLTEIMERGLLISEAPLGETVRRRRFLTRNRLIAALAGATCVVEAARRSGSVRTATYAATLNRPVLAVPGPVTSETSVGTHQLIHDGVAMLASDVDDLRDAIGPLRVEPAMESPRLPARMQEVLDALPGPSGPGLAPQAVAVRSGVNQAETLTWLRLAARQGHAREDEHGRWVFSSSSG